MRHETRTWIVTREVSLPLEYLHSGPPHIEPNTAASEFSRAENGAEHTPEALPSYVLERLMLLGPVRVSSGRTNEASRIWVRRCGQ